MSVSSLNILNNMTSTSHVFVFAAFIVASAVAQPPQDLSGIGFGARSERNFPQLPNRRHPHPPPPPPFAPPSFLQNVSVEARRDFFRIEHQANLTRAQFIAAQESWAANNSVSVEYEAWLANITATINATIVQADAAVANLSSDAQALYQQLRAIRISDNLTRQEEGQLLEEVIRSANSSARHELFKALRDIPGALPPPPRGPHGHRGGFGGPHGGFGGNQGGQGGFGGPQGGFGGNQGGPGGFGGNQGGPGGFGGGFSGQPRSSTPANF